MIDVGETIILRATCKKDGALTDPTTPVTIKVKDRDDTVTSGTATKQSTGVFEYEFTVAKSGTHRYTFYTSDDAIEQGTFSASNDIAGS